MYGYKFWPAWNVSTKKRIKMNSSPIPPIIWRAGMVVKAPLFSKRM
jgi:hypothetical protein